MGEIDRILAGYDLRHRVAITVPHILVLLSIIAATDLIAAIPTRMAQYFSKVDEIKLFELPIEVPQWTVSLLWSQLSDKDDASSWLRETLQELCQTI
jgi:DNA-binding transcriptional LysR family regulator